MKLSDLKTGMRIVLRNGDELIVLKNVKTPRYTVEDMFVQKNTVGWMSSIEYDENMNFIGQNRNWDIMRVYAQNNGDFINGSVLVASIEKFDLVWERKEVKKMTVSEICEELGYEIEIIK